MRAWFSEFSYGYAMTEDIVSSSGPLMAAPIFPSLSKEGKHGGFDVEIDVPGLPLFLQFKLSECMLRSSAQEAKSGYLAAPFYRMHLRPLKRSKQHQLLLDLEGAGHRVYYVAPAFHTEQEFNFAYRNHQVVSSSVFVSPAAIGPLPDDFEHYVSFGDAKQKFGYLFSEGTKKVEIGNWKGLFEALEDEYHRIKASLSVTLHSVETEMLESINERFQNRLDWRRFPITPEGESPIQRVASLSQIFFDSTLFIVRFVNNNTG